MPIFTSIAGLLGGSLIGLASAGLFLGNGDILGASCLISSFFVSPKKTFTDSSQSWKIIFLASFLLTAKLWTNTSNIEAAVVHQDLGLYTEFSQVSPLRHDLAGFFVGFGTKLSNGCTSGHGVSGLSRFSKRSLVTVLSFMSSAMLTATVSNLSNPDSRYIQETNESISIISHTSPSSALGSAITWAFVGLSFIILGNGIRTGIWNKATGLRSSDIITESNSFNKIFFAGVSGSLFAMGLGVSQMVVDSVVYGFLDLSGITKGTFDPSLMAVMGGALTIMTVAYQYVEGPHVMKRGRKLQSPISQINGTFNIPQNKDVGANLVYGGIMFGLGWGIGGVCPGAAVFLAGAGYPLMLYHWLPAYFCGVFGVSVLEKITGEQHICH